MNPIRILSLFTIPLAGMASAATVNTTLFTIEVPDQWQVQDDKTSTILVTGSKISDGMPSPFLSIQYCVTSASLKSPGQSQCDRTCSEKAQSLTSNDKLNGTEFSPIKKSEKEKDVTEYSVELQVPATISALMALSCSGSGQVHVGLVSDEPKEVTKQLFEKILKSLRWK